MSKRVGPVTVYRTNESGGPWWLYGQWNDGFGDGKPRWKGWWQLGRDVSRHGELAVAVGGEDSMVQFGIAIPRIAQAYVGRRVPRKWLESWVYTRRVWSIKPGYIGDLVWVEFAHDSDMADMRDYYVRQRDDPDCERCKHSGSFHADPVRVPPHMVKSLDDVEALTQTFPNPEHKCITPAQVNHGSEPCDCPGYVPEKPRLTGPQLWPGRVWKVGPLRDRLLGRPVHREVPLTPDGQVLAAGATFRRPTWELLRASAARERYNHTVGSDQGRELIMLEHTLVPLPEGSYPAVVSLYRSEWKRPRAPWTSRIVYRATLTPRVPIPEPGKGENSWDMDDDGLYSITCAARSVADVTAEAVRSVLERRARHGGANWKPDAGWPVVVEQG